MLSKILALCLLIFFFVSPLEAAHIHKEKDYQAAWCSEHNGITEYVLDDGTRVDCFTDEYAIEFDYAPKWAEAVGQALYYAEKTGKKAGIALIMEKPTDERYKKRLLLLCEKYDIRLWIITPSDLNNRNLG